MVELDERAHVYARELATLAGREADQVAVRVQYGARLVAANRFAEVWPNTTRTSSTRRALQGWYLHAFEQHLAEPVAGTVQTIDGTEAGRVLATVIERTRVSRNVALGVITALAHDARILARGTAIARGRLVEAALNGHISKLFPRRPAADLGLRQAISEQWYARCFHAVIGPKVLGVPTAPVTPMETHAVGTCLAANQARILLQHGDPIGLASEQSWREHASWWWANQRTTQRKGWLRREGYGPHLAMTSFGRLPPYLQSRLLEQHPPSDLDLSRSVDVGAPVERAARMFDAEPVRPATDAEQRAERAIFTRGGGAIPPNMIPEQPDLPLLDALRELRRNNRNNRSEVGGLGYFHQWWSDPRKVDQAVQMRLAGAQFGEIANQLSIGIRSLRKGLLRSNVDPDALRRGSQNERILEAQRGSGKRQPTAARARRSPPQGDREPEGRE